MMCNFAYSDHKSNVCLWCYRHKKILLKMLLPLDHTKSLSSLVNFHEQRRIKIDSFH